MFGNPVSQFAVHSSPFRPASSIPDARHDTNNIGEIKKYAVAHGMHTLRMDGWRKVLAGITTLEEVLRVTSENES